MSGLLLILALIKFVDHKFFFKNFATVFDRIQKLSFLAPSQLYLKRI
jgi:hypothetical protein